MKFLCRIIGWFLIALALACWGYELAAWAGADGERYRVFALGELIFAEWPGLLPYVQAGVQRNLHPAIWDPGIQFLLLRPGWAVFGLPGLLMTALCWRRGRKRKPMFRK